jgi:hypothetical protein
MSQQMADTYDQELRTLLESFCPDGIVTLQVTARVIWGRPQPGGQ